MTAVRSFIRSKKIALSGALVACAVLPGAAVVASSSADAAAVAQQSSHNTYTWTTKCSGYVVRRTDVRATSTSWRASIETHPCGRYGTRIVMESNPKLRFYDSHGRQLAITVRVAGSKPKGTLLSPACIVLTGTPSAKGSVNVARVVVEASTTHPVLGFKLPVKVGANRTITITHWLASSGNCLGAA